MFAKRGTAGREQTHARTHARTQACALDGSRAKARGGGSLLVSRSHTYMRQLHVQQAEVSNYLW